MLFLAYGSALQVAPAEWSQFLMQCCHPKEVDIDVFDLDFLKPIAQLTVCGPDLFQPPGLFPGPQLQAVRCFPAA